MIQTEVSIPTPDGDARAFTFHPSGEGPWPAVIFFMDAPAIRPALFGMCGRLAGHGYFVLLPNGAVELIAGFIGRTNVLA